MNRRSFYDQARGSLFGGQLNQSQVEGMETILDEAESRAGFDQRWLAYILATAFHETARTMQPIREYGKGKGRKYGVPDPQTVQVYYGRGLVQLTWKDNYKKMGAKLGVDLVHNPDLALNDEIATKICFQGMIAGDFTGVGLGKYFTASCSDWVNARRIINGTDRATMIAEYGKKFYAAVLAANSRSVADLTPNPMPDPEEVVALPAGARGAPIAPVESGPEAEAEAIIDQLLREPRGEF